MASCKRIKGSDKTQSLGNLNRNSMAGVNLSECEVAEQGRENGFLIRCPRGRPPSSISVFITP
jgi:hypothetical protein